VSDNLEVPAVRRRNAEQPPAVGQAIFIHGSLDDGQSFRRVLDRLPRWDSITYDRRGWGRSALLTASLTHDVADLRRIVSDLGPSGLVGHSFGATVACTVAATLPDHVQWVVAYEPPLPWLPWWPDIAPWEEIVLRDGDHDPAAAAERLLRAVLGDEGWERLPDRVRQQRRSAGPSLVSEMRALRTAPPGFDPLIVTAPVLVAAGSGGLEHHRTVAARLAELLPHGRYHEIEHAGHSAHTEHPAQFADLVELAAALPAGYS
jgi:pimeloyl-ACP methyl ester carboxylesterase